MDCELKKLVMMLFCCKCLSSNRVACAAAGCQYDKIVCGGGRASIEVSEFYWVNTVLCDLKYALRSIYHALKPKYVQCYSVEFEWS